MKILVCIKQVPDMEAKFNVNGAGNGVVEEDLAFRVNEYDEYAIQAAADLKASQAGSEVVVLTVGAKRATEALKKALAMGADRAIHVEDEEASTKDSNQIAASIHQAIAAEGFEAIFMGNQSQDRGSGQVGPILAEMLGIESVTTIVDFSCDGTKAAVSRELEGGIKQKVELALPALFTCQMGLNKPKYPTLPNIMKAKKKEIKAVASGDVAASALSPNKLFVPEKKGGATFLEGDAASLADQLVQILKEKTSVMS